MNRINTLLARAGAWFAPVLLLFVRVYWGWQYHVTGWAKLRHLEKPTAFFAQLHIPAPHANAIIVSVTETFGGLLIILGLGTRFIVPICIFEMLIAYITADRDAFGAIFSDPDKFTGAAPFQFLAAFLVLFAFGPGRLSLDGWLFNEGRSRSSLRSGRAASGGPEQR